MKALPIILSVAFLAGCGGGRDEGVVENVATFRVLAGSMGDMSKYLGSWTSDCGVAATGGGAIYVDSTFFFNAQAADTVTGTLTVREYGSPTCSTAATSTTTTTVAVQYTAQVVPQSLPDFAGTADQLAIGETTATMNTATTVGFFENFGRLQIATSGNTFSKLSVTYRKL